MYSTGTRIFNCRQLYGLWNGDRAMNTWRKRVFQLEFFEEHMRYAPHYFKKKKKQQHYENNIWSECPRRVNSAADEWNEMKNLQMMQNNLITCFIYIYTLYWWHPGTGRRLTSSISASFFSHSRPHISIFN